MQKKINEYIDRPLHGYNTYPLKRFVDELAKNKLDKFIEKVQGPIKEKLHKQIEDLTNHCTRGHKQTLSYDVPKNLADDGAIGQQAGDDPEGKIKCA